MGALLLPPALSEEVERLEYLIFLFEMSSGRWLQSDMADDSVGDPCPAQHGIRS